MAVGLRDTVRLFCEHGETAIEFAPTMPVNGFMARVARAQRAHRGAFNCACPANPLVDTALEYLAAIGQPEQKGLAGITHSAA